MACHHTPLQYYFDVVWQKLGLCPAILPGWDILKLNKSFTVCGSSIMYAPNIPGSTIALGGSKSTWAVAPLFIGAQKVLTFTRNLKCILNSAFLLSPFFFIHSHQFPGKRIDAGVDNSPWSPINAISLWRKSALPLMAKKLLAKCTALMVSNFPKMHPKMIGSIVIGTLPYSTDACAFDSRCSSRSSFVSASSISNNLATTDPFFGAFCVGTTAAPVG